MDRNDKAPAVSLREITRDNWEDCIRLAVGEGRERYVASNVYSLAESRFYPDMVPLAIYAGETMVGFVMYGLDPRDNQFWIYRLMVDRAHQGTGYGRAALAQVLARMRRLPGCRAVVIGYEPDNLVAARLYASFGFREIGPAPWGETLAKLDLAGAISG